MADVMSLYMQLMDQLSRLRELGPTKTCAVIGSFIVFTVILVSLGRST